MFTIGRLSIPTTSIWINQKRWMRRKPAKPAKPPILPPAKLKLYKVQTAKWLPPEDVADLLWRRHVYNNAILSMRRLFREEYEQQKEACIGMDRMRKEVGEELDRLLAENDQRNLDLAAERAERERETLGKLEEETLQEIERRIEEQTKDVEEKTKEVERMIELSKKQFITKENMHKQIRKALDQPVNFDFAIDLTGKQIPSVLPEKIAKRHRKIHRTKKSALKLVKKEGDVDPARKEQQDDGKAAGNEGGKAEPENEDGEEK